jgi:glutathione S-transferase
MLTLYDFGNSVCCQKVRITLCAKGLDWEPIQVDLFKTEQYDPKYLKLNPKGVVPTLVHDGKPVIESTLICEYIDETFAQTPQLIPADPWLQSRMRLWSKMVDEGLHDGVTELSFSAMFRERMKNMPPEIREKRFRNVGDPPGQIASSQPMNWALNLLLLRMASPLTNGRSRCWKIRSAKLADLGFSDQIHRWPT